MCFNVCNIEIKYIIIRQKSSKIHIIYKNNMERRIFNVRLEGKRIGFVLTGSFCTFRKTID